MSDETKVPRWSNDQLSAVGPGEPMCFGCDVTKLEAALARVTEERDVAREQVRAGGWTKIMDCEEANAMLCDALALYQCAGPPKCREPQMNDGSCLADISGRGACGVHAMKALAQEKTDDS